MRRFPHVPILLLVALLLACTRPEIRDLTILHLNDLHARLLPLTDRQGGFAQVAAVIHREKKDCASCVVLFGGDMVQGTPVSTLFEGVPVFELASRLGIDVGTLGNHELDYGWAKIAEYQQLAGFPLITANVTNDTGELLTGQGHVVRDVGGLRVAVIGAMLESLPELVTPKQRGPWHVRPLVDTIRREAARLRSSSDIVVVLGHLSDEEDEAILREVPEVAVVVSGHNHAGRERPLEIDGRLAVKVKGYGREVGRLELKVDPATRGIVRWSWTALQIHADEIVPDRKVAVSVAEWERKVAEIVDVGIGTSRRQLSADELLPILQRALAEQTGADVALLNRGGIRDVLPEGPLLARHVWNILPFDNRVVTATVAGRDLPDDVRKEWNVQPDRQYRFATIDYLATMRFSSSGIRFSEPGAPIRDVIIDWIRKQKTVG